MPDISAYFKYNNGSHDINGEKYNNNNNNNNNDIKNDNDNR